MLWTQCVEQRLYAGGMGRKVWTGAELENMTPAEQDALFDASIATDLSQVPAEFLDRVRRRTLERINEAESRGP